MARVGTVSGGSKVIVTGVAVGRTHVKGTLDGVSDSVAVIVSPWVTVSIDAAYIVQVVQDSSNSVPLIEGRDAVVRVFPVADQANDVDASVTVRFRSEDSQQWFDSVTGTLSGIPQTMNEGSLDGFNAVVPASAVSKMDRFDVRISGDHFISPPRYSATVSRKSLDEFEFVAVPVQNGGSGDASVRAWVDGLTTNDSNLYLIRNAVPMSSLSVTKHAPFQTSEDLSTLGSWLRLLSDLYFLRKSDASSGYYYGAVVPVNSIDGHGLVGDRASVGRISPGTIAHQVGHNMGLMHAPCNEVRPDPNFPTSDGSIEMWGFDISMGISTVGALKSPDKYNDIMTSCGDYWISAYHFERAMYAILSAPPAGSAAPGGVAPVSQRGRMLVVRGQADPTPALEPAFVINAPPHVPTGGGPYRVRGKSIDGSELFSYAFTPTEVEFGGSAFTFLIPYDESWADALESIVLTGPGGTATLTEGSASPTALLFDRESGRLRGVLRDVGGMAMDHGPGTVVLVSDGIPKRGSGG